MENLAKEQPSGPSFMSIKEANHRYHQGNHTILVVVVTQICKDIA